MKLVGPLREFSTIRFEGSFSRIKQKSYFNFLNLPLTVANFYAFRESFSALYQSPALYPGANFLAPIPTDFSKIPVLRLHFPKHSLQYNVSSVTFHGSVYKPGDIVCFFESGLVFHQIKHIILSFANELSLSETCELENVALICSRIEHHYDARLNKFRVIETETEMLEVFMANRMTCLKPIKIFNTCLYPPTLGRVPGRRIEQ